MPSLSVKVAGFAPACDVDGAAVWFRASTPDERGHSRTRNAVDETLANDRTLQQSKIPTMVSKAVPVETQHEDMIHDAQLDYYGKRLATGSSDKTIRIFNVVKGEAKGEPVVLKGSHGLTLPSALFLPRARGEVQDGWERIKEHTLHSASVNSIAWAPYELGPILACASSDGKISVLSFQNDGSTDAVIFNAHGSGANTISWAPSVLASSSGQNKAAQPGQQVVPQKRFVSGGSDNAIRIWTFDETAKKWVEEEEIKGHDNWVRDVAWGPNIGLPGQYIASASQVSSRMTPIAHQ
ncbi:vesicle budding-related protein [Trichosporon asahii var. asahii CBS 8904]|uniref:Vesicle budding-related protein n=2 Tax=Trichosporon asahii var. asahii TaxID=189963 RepID=K1VUP3_TRIAC|nr:vesicle budding-related protein [Trichosporon asahii var. asahii CBS 2479]EJT45094.1 vesicle budding-related protein [Trichosporon asahii var. asahii CBS 2479]EKD00498.1 vesicle budding-related protein [Trichosporon asahii var. asahii CBS 8904]